MAEYLGQDEDLGSIEDGKLADFFLVTADPTKDLKALKAISMVVANGTVYFPSEIYPHFGIKPFAPAPQIVTVARSEEHTSELQSLMRISYAVFCLKKKKSTN